MSDDLLSEATRALRDETADDGASGRFTRARIMASAHDRRVWKRTRVAFLIPIAATFMAASAVGATGGPRQAFEAVARVFGLHADAPPAPAVPTPSRRSEAPRSAAPTNAPAVEEPVAVPPPPEVTAPVVEAPAPAVAPPSTAGSVRVPGGGGAPAADPTFDLYRVAHRAHFVDHDSARALQAWDAYLKAAPRGAFALEARYNRALCLVRLDRRGEARAALTPFADGRYGGYRKDDATKLIAALPAEP